MSSRPRPVSQLPKAPVHCAVDSIISEKAVLSGIQPISLGSSTVLHPHSRVLTTYGSVSIGPGSIISERAYIGHIDAPPDSVAEALPSLDVTLGANVVVESSAHVTAMQVGDGSHIGVGARIGVGAVLGKHCKIAPKAVVADGALLPDHTVIYADGATRHQRPGLEALRSQAHEKQLTALRKLIKSDLAKHGAVTEAVAGG